ncbi:MAG: TIGR03915 family putative DNA repair protein [Bacteroidota bacterium]
MTFTYDHTYEGLLTVIFETYRLKTEATRIVAAEEWQPTFFDKPTFVETNEAWAKRVLAGVRKKSGIGGSRLMYRVFLSEQPDVEMLIYDFVRQSMSSSISILDNFSDDTVRRMHELSKKIGREVHRMHAFVRFQRTKDDIYYSVIEPDFNVLPLLPPHFEDRYSSQHWLIYDRKRRYGIYYNQEDTEFITFADDHLLKYRQLQAEILGEQESDYQRFWKTYFDSVNIPERRNMKLHLQHVPKRYWKYLSEKRLNIENQDRGKLLE